jgi:hypothetical protein
MIIDTFAVGLVLREFSIVEVSVREIVSALAFFAAACPFTDESLPTCDTKYHLLDLKTTYDRVKFYH